MRTGRMSLRRGAVCALLLAGAVASMAAAGAGCSGKEIPQGGLMLVMRTDGSLTQATRLHVEVSSSDGATTYRNADYAIPSETTLPTTLGVAANGSATASVAINVSVWAGSTLLDDRKNQVFEIPKDRVAELDIVFSGKCTHLAVVEGAGAGSSCPQGQTCDPASGACGDGAVNGGQLPTFAGDAGSAPGASAGTIDASVGDSAPSEQGDAGGDAPTCTASGACDAGPCATGQNVCAGGAIVCQTASTTANGTPCGGDAGDQVCNQGACVTCAVGTDCSVAGSCQKKAIDCSSGSPVCAAAGNAPDGDPCALPGGGGSGANGYCNKGTCGPCTPGGSCTPTDPCHVGKASCATGVQTCNDTGALAGNGTSCGMNKVCSAGICVGCTENVKCTPANPCHAGTTSCATGAQTCTDIGGNGCAAGLVCERYGASACVDPSWAQWPMPNAPVDSPPAPKPQSYADNNDGTVTDKVTGLMWQKAAPTTTFTWGGAGTAGTAQSYCASLPTGGYKDWRLPSVIELVSIVDWGVVNPSINAAFPGTPANYFWSSTPGLPPPSAWYVNFNLGGTFNNGGVGATYFVRCVR